MTEKIWHEYENPYEMFTKTNLKLEHYLDEPGPSAFLFTMMKEITDNMNAPGE